jgi:hypothetical protein
MLTTESPPAARRHTADRGPLPIYRVNLMRVGYLVMGVGLAVFRWPSVLEASSLPTMEGVVVSMLTAMSLLAFLGLRYPIRMLPILLFETAWKVLWLAIVAVPHMIASDMDAPTTELLSSIIWVVIVIAVTPWDFVWRTYVTAPAERLRRIAPDRGHHV